MALLHPQLLIASLPHFTPKKVHHTPIKFISNVNHTLKSSRTRIHSVAHETELVERRSANYQPSIWDFDYIQNLQSQYQEEAYEERGDVLMEEVRAMMDKVKDCPLQQLEVVDVLQRLGLCYQFEIEIGRVLANIYYSTKNDEVIVKQKDLHAAALEFRLLRQHGLSVPQDVFSSFMDESGDKFKESLCEDINGMLSLYEASYLSVEGETILEKARDFTAKHLQHYVTNNIDSDNDYYKELINHALELPLHWRVTRLESRWFIDFYQKRHDKNDVFIELAILDYNMLQALHQQDLKIASRWWNKLGLAENLKFSRDRLMENFLWQSGIAHEPRFGYYRRKATQVFALITTIDDVYDIYGTLNELELFTDAVQRWDINAIEKLPNYMKICFLGLYNSTNEIAFDIQKHLGVHAISYLRKGWAGICKAYLKEAMWYYSGYRPTLDEYMNNACVSIGMPVILAHTCFFVHDSVSEEALQCLENGDHDLIRYSAMILRLADDLGTSSHEIARGDILKSVQCHMHETGASEEEARKHIWHLISETWNKLNEIEDTNCPFSRSLIKIAKNIGRMSQSMYQHGDGHASQDSMSKDRILSLLIQPIPLM